MAYVSHVGLVRKARNVAMHASFRKNPLMCQGGSAAFTRSMDDIVVASEAWGIDFNTEVAVITDDVPIVHSCIAETRCLEMIADGAPSTPRMQFSSATIGIEMFDLLARRSLA